MESSLYSQEDLIVTNPINRYLTSVRTSFLYGGALQTMFAGNQAADAWLFRDDIGAPHGIKGYEEQVNSVGMHHGHSHWPSEIQWNAYNSAT